MSEDPIPYRITPKVSDAATVEALAFLMVRELQKRGLTPAEIRGFILCAKAFGGLRPLAPKWLRRQQAFLLTHGKGVSEDDQAAASAIVTSSLADDPNTGERFPNPPPSPPL